MPRIDIGEVRYFVEQFLRESQQLKEALTNYRKAVAKIVADNDIKGEMADSAKDYYQTVHYPIVDTTKSCMTDAEEILKKYVSDFHNQVDPSMNARIDSDELQELQGEVRKCQNRYEDLLVKMKSMAGGSLLGQQIGMQLGMQTAMGQLQHEMQIIERYLDFDMSHQNVMYDVLSKLHQVKQGLAEIQSSKAFNTVSHTFNTKAIHMGWLNGLVTEKKPKQYNFDDYTKTLEGSYWVLSKNGITDQESAKATIAFNDALKDGTIKLADEESGDFMTDYMIGAVKGINILNPDQPLTKMQSFSIIAGVMTSMVAVRGSRSIMYSKKNILKIESDLVIKQPKKKKEPNTSKLEPVVVPKNVNKAQYNVIRDVESGAVKLITTKRKGNYGEMKMDVHYESTTYTRISSDRATSLDDKIVKGIDGIYENASPPPKYVIAEAKYNTSRLSKTQDGLQMSDTWVEQSRRLEKAVGKSKADEIIQETLLNPENVEKVLINIDKNGKVVESVLDEAGKKIKN
ncbi:hypothetical protein HCJ39_09300 [Listeria rocourtiae]|uniref:T7SS effector LXG polymorphic toxin n=1 Tax=Listeria rocourtiae TaxID=647910 RepID=UPI001628F6FE|nr:T7SS effector LXG polymorphic toxin [Listeria rocourtiae]MBC1604907.1 hypothetical protein [Listeria rocourtiae]